MVRAIGCLFAILSVIGCQHAPTKVTETSQREFVQVVERTQNPLELGDNTVILDVRSSFDYGLNRVQNSLAFPWQNLAEDTRRAEVLHDKRQAALRLSLQGLTPESQVVILGNGINGQGEEGRLAWTLLYLGFRDVQVSAVEAFRKSMTQNPTPPAKNVPYWTINTRDEMQIERAELMHAPSEAVVIDARSSKEFASAPSQAFGLAKVVNVEWKKFYTAKGRPDPDVKSTLARLGISSESKIILISNHGVRSAAAAYALIALGFPHVQNFTGGWQSLEK